MNHVASSAAAAAQDARVLAIGVFEDDWTTDAALRSVDEGLGGRLLPLLEGEEFKAGNGKSRRVDTLGAIGAARVVVWGLGKRAEVTGQRLRDYAHGAARAAIASRANSLAVAVPGGQLPVRALDDLVLAATLGPYRFDRYKKDARPTTLEEVRWVGAESGAVASSSARAAACAAGIWRVRDLVNEPPGTCTPGHLVEQARAIAEAHGLECTVLDRDEAVAKGMGCIEGVSAGSDEGAYLIHLVHRPAGASRGRVALVGKGITFDSGGYDIKPAAAMLDMKIDMAGAATVLGTMEAVGALKPDVEVHGIVPTCENLVNGRAYKPGDVLRAYKGKTIEIGNTDAEGRLILADALGHANDQQPDAIVDLATLTGACVVALGNYTAGMFSNDEALAARFEAAAGDADESFWRMPLDPRLRGQLDSRVADIKNVGKRWGGAITAGLFLKEFVGSTPWVHLDIAGPAYLDDGRGAIPRGGTGFGVLTLTRLLEDFTT